MASPPSEPPIPLARPWLGEPERRALAEVLDSGRLVLGPRLARFEAALAERCGRRFAVGVASGTAALRLALEALGVGPGDEVPVPAFGWPSPAHAVARLGAVPVLFDVGERSWNAEPEGLCAARSGRAAAAVVVDQYGVPVRAEPIREAAAGLPLLEDAACALGSAFAGGRPCGSLGTVAILSFHPRKLVTTGEGGAVLTDEPELAERVRRLRDHGRSDGRFVEPGDNLRLSEIGAALGLAQLGRLDEMVRRRAALAARYRERLEGLVAVQALPEGARWNAQTLGVRLPEGWDTARRERLLRWLRAERGVEAGPLGHAFHRLPSLRPPRSRVAPGGLPVAESLAERGLALPLYPQMAEAAVERVASALREGLERFAPSQEVRP